MGALTREANLTIGDTDLDNAHQKLVVRWSQEALYPGWPDDLEKSRPTAITVAKPNNSKIQTMF
jgi:hypothetical protein